MDAISMQHHVMPGQVISAEMGYLRGHGCYEKDGQLIASVNGVVERVNKLITVRPLHTRYTGEIGDVVVGRIIEVGHQQWKVDIFSARDGNLALSSINFGGTQLRRIQATDEYNMRTFFVEGDLISAEVCAIHQSGQIALQTRGSKFGKLVNGQLIHVPPQLIKRVKNHIFSFPFGVDVVLGHNGGIWISSPPASDDNTAVIKVTAETREKIARVRNCITILSNLYAPISPESIQALYETSLKSSTPAKDLLKPEIIQQLSSVIKIANHHDMDLNELDEMIV